MSERLAPCSTIGILGTGQLGRMLASAAARLGFRVETYGPEIDPPAAQIANSHHVAEYDDQSALELFAQNIDVATYEFENIPPETVRKLINFGVPVRPDDRILSVCQDRLPEKQFLRQNGFQTAPYYEVNSDSDLELAIREAGPKGILKTRRFGYDGKGQAFIGDDADVAAIWSEFNTPSIFEGLVSFEAEFSVIAARSIDGKCAFFDIPKNDHADGILRISTVPSGLPLPIDSIHDSIRTLMDKLEYVGVMTTEFFWSAGGGAIANEIAPRVHNSGHWTHEACQVSQFEQHIRAVAGWPLGNPVRHSNAVMTNLIGHDVDDWVKITESPALSLTLYGKSEVRAARKMGHSVRITPMTS